MTAYHPQPAIAHAYQAELADEQLRAMLALFVRPGTPVPEFLAEDFRRTDPRSRTGVAESIGRGEMRDKRAIVRELRVPLAMIHGAHDAIIRRDFLAGVVTPTLWRGAIQDIADAGHMPQWETPAEFDGLLGAFAAECHAQR
jgi:pimeloyl-ACP methyl ester carboxylesterase